MAKKQYFGIKYPFTNNDIEKYELDLCQNQRQRVISDILHLMFTPKGQRLRNPEFGTNLIKYIFEPNEELTWGAVKKEVRETISKWITGVTINDIQVASNNEQGNEIYVRIDYSVKEGNYTYKNHVVVEI